MRDIAPAAGSPQDLTSPPPSVLGLLDFCKGVAIASIVLVHVCRGWFGWQGVHVFLVLSGFALTYVRAAMRVNAPAAWPVWFLRRAERILPAYWLTALAGFLLVIAIRYLLPQGANAAHERVKPVPQLFLDLLLLRNVSYRTMFGEPNAALWFVPLVAGFYLVFPWLYGLVTPGRPGTAATPTSGRLLLVLVAAAAVEFGYRAFAIYVLDGMPVAYGNGAAWGLPRVAAPLDRLPPAAPYQLWAPFGFFPSRLGAFVVGMVGAAALVQDAPRFCGALFRTWALLAGLALWFLGNTLLYAGRWGWVFADFVLALGLTLVLINLARYAECRRPKLFAALSRLGQWSYPIFLTHLLFGQTYALAYPALGGNAALRIALLGGALLATVLAAWLLVRLEASPWPALLVRRLLPFLPTEDRNAASGQEATTAASP